MDWRSTTKRFGVGCFLQPEPPDTDGEGDAAEFFDNVDEARKWAHKALQAGRFKYLVLWDGGLGELGGTGWERVADFDSPKSD